MAGRVRRRTREVFLAAFALAALVAGCEGSCYYTDVYPDGHIRYYCYYGHTEMDCENTEGDVGFLGETTSVDDFVKGECCEEEHGGKTYTVLDGEECP